MTLQRKFEIALFVSVLVVAGIFLRQWILARELAIRAEDQAAATKQVTDATNAAIKSRDAAAAATTQQLAQQAAAVQTPTQAGQVIYRYLPAPPAVPGSPQPATPRIVQSDDLSPQGAIDLPNAPGSLLLSPDQAVAQAKADLACQASAGNLTACRQDEADLKTQIASLQKESDAWKTAAKGGTALQRFLRVAKYVGCAAGGAIAGSVADKAHPSTGSAIGGAAGVAACSLF